MKISEAWLREWVNPHLDRDALCTALTMAGLEVEEAAAVAPAFTGVMVGEVLRIEKHPEADRLNLCEVSVGGAKPLNIVCGADNVAVGVRVPVAMIGAVLPNDLTIKPAKIRGIDSEGMLCSARELGLPEEYDGLLLLSKDAPIGKDFRDYWSLNDFTIDVSITPNRGDCLSVRGLAREVGAITNNPMVPVKIIEAVKKSRDVLPVHVTDPAACPHYVGRVIRHLKPDAVTPIWMKERLRRSNIRSIHPVVDIMNYVMIELGQPMHAFDLHKIREGIDVRFSVRGEKVALLDGSTQELDDKTLVIADKLSALAIAGVMGGVESSVTATTQDVFLESAYFAPAVVARQRQHYHLNSDSAYRYERGVDTGIQRQAIERATALILEMAGGEAGPIVETSTPEALPKKREIRVSDQKIVQILGVAVPSVDVKRILTALGFVCKRESDKWIVLPPTWRFDITLPEDVIEEIARLYGYDKIPMQPMAGMLRPAQPASENNAYADFRQAFSANGFHEIISYSFIDRKTHALLDPDEPYRELLNPITDEMSVMRTNLWAGLINTFNYNKSRQQHRVKLFELGACFQIRDGKLQQVPKLGGLLAGPMHPDQWGMATREADFFDLKGALDTVMTTVFPGLTLGYEAGEHSALHPGQTAAILLDKQKIGIIGALHPGVLQAMGIKGRAYVFELELSGHAKPERKPYQEVSRFPEIRRDLAILVDQTIPAQAIQDTIKVSAGDWLKECFIFDVYQGQGVAPGLKSVALAMVLQHPVRTLVDEEVVALTDRVVQALKGQLGAELRS
jgi:phenylalanyl-tRNA synthetase beta chain